MIFKAVIIGKLTYATSAWWALPPPTTANGLNPSSDEAFVQDYVLPTRHLWLTWSKMLMTICLTASSFIHSFIHLHQTNGPYHNIVFCTIMNMS